MVPPTGRWSLCAGALISGAILAPVALAAAPVPEPVPQAEPATSVAAEPTPLDAGVPGETETSSEPSVITAAKPAKPADTSDVEVVRERYSDGKVKVEREVIRDDQENYVNHGAWKMWDKAGNVVAEGRYVNGQRHGTWTGWFMPAEVALLSDMPYREYQGPFVSQAEFDAGKLNGHWVIYDSKQHKISDWQYVAGRRHGTWTSWYANGRKMRESNYINGDLDGDVTEWSSDGKVTSKDLYQGGHKLARKVEYHSANQKKSDGMYLFAKQALPKEQEDLWWDAKLMKFSSEGRDVRHGEWMAWHPNGQIHNQGAYDHDAPVGTFTWWYSNGQKAVQGNFVAGQRDGQWTWYHQNGQKATHGEFAAGGPHGRWIWWSLTGKVSQKVNYSPSEKTDQSEAAAVVADKGTHRVGDKVEGADEPTQADEPKTVESQPEPTPEPAGADADLVPQAAGEPEAADKK